MATAQLANNGYRIAKSWQYQDSNPLPDVNNQTSDTPLNNNTLRPILMANYPPIQTQAKTISLRKFCSFIYYIVLIKLKSCVHLIET